MSASVTNDKTSSSKGSLAVNTPGDNTSNNNNTSSNSNNTSGLKKGRAVEINNVAKVAPLQYYTVVSVFVAHIALFFYVRCFELISMCTRAPLHFFIFVAIIITVASLYAKPPSTLAIFAKRMVLLMVVFTQLGKEMDLTISSNLHLANTKMIGKVSIVTGANGKIGSETVAKLASLGSTVILACRNLEKCNAAKEKILLDSQKNNASSLLHDSLVTMELNLSDLESVFDFTAKFKTRFNKLDVLINSAGFTRSKGSNSRTAQEYEESMGAMHLGHMALTNWLYDPLTFQPPSVEVPSSTEMDEKVVEVEEEDTGSRVVYLGANAYLFGSFGSSSWDINSELSVFDDPNPGTSLLGSDLAYSRAKLANVLTAFETQKRLDKAAIEKRRTEEKPRRKVICSVVNPGTVDVESSFVKKYLKSEFLYPYVRKTESAIATLMFAIHSNDYTPGSYIDAMTYNHDLLGFKEKYGATHSTAYPSIHHTNADASADSNLDNTAGSETAVVNLSSINYFSLDLWYWKNNEDMGEDTSKKLWDSSQIIIKKWKAVYDAQLNN